MAQAQLGCFSGTVTPGVNMVDILKENELKENPYSILQFGTMVIRKFALQCPPGTKLKINGKEITVFSGFFELGMGQIDVVSLEFSDEVEINMYYMY